jgi:adenylate kinase family enzyme
MNNKFNHSSGSKHFFEWAYILLTSSNITSIIGDWGMGKSTFAQKLSLITSQIVFHLEQEQFICAGVPHPIDQFLRRYYKALTNGNCIIDGNAYRSGSITEDPNDYNFIIERLEKSNAIVFFDGDPEKVKSDYIERTKKVENSEEKRIGGSWNSVADKDTAINAYFDRKEMFNPKLNKFKDKIITLKNREQINALIDYLSTRTSDG